MKTKKYNVRQMIESGNSVGRIRRLLEEDGEDTSLGPKIGDTVSIDGSECEVTELAKGGYMVKEIDDEDAEEKFVSADDMAECLKEMEGEDDPDDDTSEEDGEEEPPADDDEEGMPESRRRKRGGRANEADDEEFDPLRDEEDPEAEMAFTADEDDEEFPYGEPTTEGDEEELPFVQTEVDDDEEFPFSEEDDVDAITGTDIPESDKTKKKPGRRS